MSKKSLSTLLLITLVLLVATTPLPVTGETNVNVMALSGPTGLSLLRLLEEQPSITPGVNINYTVIKSPDQMSAKLISGEADIAAVPINLASIMYNRGIPLQVAAIMNWGVLYVVGSDDSITSWSQLKGQEIGVTGKGSTPDLLFRYLLTANGANPDHDVQIKYYPSPAELAQLVIAGKVTLATLPEPWVTEVLTRNSALKLLLDYQAEWSRVEGRTEAYPQSALVVKSRLAKDHPAFVSAFLESAAASNAWVVQHPTAAAPLAQKHLFISAAAAGEAIPRCHLRFIPARQVRGDIEYYLQKLMSFQPQSIGGKLPDDGFYWQE